MNILKRMVNRAGRDLGIRVFPWADEFSLSTDKSHESIFDSIHKTNYWGSEESVSGGGSTDARTRAYGDQLIELIGARGFRSMFDAPCGDLNWMPRVIAATGIAYCGGDVSPVALDHARLKLPQADLRQFDIRSDAFPEADVWHCRDCLFHLSFADGLAALRNFARSSIPFALITTNSGLWVRNLDIETGGHRVTDLERAPYRLPKPILRLKDYPSGTEFPRFVAQWRREDIARAVLQAG
jgi:hypothetical protein